MSHSKSEWVSILWFPVVLFLILATSIILAFRDNKEPCWKYNVIIEVSYIDGTVDTLELSGNVRGNYYIGPDDPFPDRPKIEIVSIKGIGCLVHYPDCRDEEQMSIAAWNVGRYRILGHSRGYCDCVNNQNKPNTYESNTRMARSH